MSAPRRLSRAGSPGLFPSFAIAGFPASDVRPNFSVGHSWRVVRISSYVVGRSPHRMASVGSPSTATCGPGRAAEPRLGEVSSAGAEPAPAPGRPVASAASPSSRAAAIARARVSASGQDRAGKVCWRGLGCTGARQRTTSRTASAGGQLVPELAGRTASRAAGRCGPRRDSTGRPIGAGRSLRVRRGEEGLHRAEGVARCRDAGRVQRRKHPGSGQGCPVGVVEVEHIAQGGLAQDASRDRVGGWHGQPGLGCGRRTVRCRRRCARAGLAGRECERLGRGGRFARRRGTPRRAGACRFSMPGSA